jgi:hypothetical protein
MSYDASASCSVCCWSARRTAIRRSVSALDPTIGLGNEPQRHVALGAKPAGAFWTKHRPTLPNVRRKFRERAGRADRRHLGNRRSTPSDPRALRLWGPPVGAYELKAVVARALTRDAKSLTTSVTEGGPCDKSAFPGFSLNPLANSHSASRAIRTPSTCQARNRRGRPAGRAAPAHVACSGKVLTQFDSNRKDRAGHELAESAGGNGNRRLKHDFEQSTSARCKYTSALNLRRGTRSLAEF